MCVTVQYIPAGSRGQHSTHVRNIWLLQAGRPLLCQSTGEQEMTLVSGVKILLDQETPVLTDVYSVTAM